MKPRAGKLHCRLTTNLRFDFNDVAHRNLLSNQTKKYNPGTKKAAEDSIPGN
jgi:hypothetical protein